MLHIFGYLDPGTGSIIFQSIVGIVAGIGLFGRRVFTGMGQKLRSLFSRGNSGDSAD